MSEPPDPFTRSKDGVDIAIRVTPRASRARIGALAAEADGTPVIRVSVTAAPDGGKANDAVIRLLAKAWRVPKTSLSVVSGATGRRKTIHAAGDADDLSRRLTEWMAGRDG